MRRTSGAIRDMFFLTKYAFGTNFARKSTVSSVGDTLGGKRKAANAHDLSPDASATKKTTLAVKSQVHAFFYLNTFIQNFQHQPYIPLWNAATWDWLRTTKTAHELR